MTADRIVLAAVAGAHGIGGEVRLKLFAQDVGNIAKARLDAEGGGLKIAAFRTSAQGAIARIDGVTSRDAAEALRGFLITIDREALPPLATGEYYWADLIGLPCVSDVGETLGQVVNIENYGAGDVLEIERPDKTRVLVPFREGVASSDGMRIVVDPAFIV